VAFLPCSLRRVLGPVNFLSGGGNLLLPDCVTIPFFRPLSFFFEFFFLFVLRFLGGYGLIISRRENGASRPRDPHLVVVLGLTNGFLSFFPTSPSFLRDAFSVFCRFFQRRGRLPLNAFVLRGYERSLSFLPGFFVHQSLWISTVRLFFIPLFFSPICYPWRLHRSVDRVTAPPFQFLPNVGFSLAFLDGTPPVGSRPADSPRCPVSASLFIFPLMPNGMVPIREWAQRCLSILTCAISGKLGGGRFGPVLSPHFFPPSFRTPKGNCMRPSIFRLSGLCFSPLSMPLLPSSS